MIKKRQYYIWQFKLSDLIEKDNQLVLSYRREQAVSSSETLMYYILNEKIMERTYDSVEEFKDDANGKKVKVKKNLLPLISIEAGRSRSKEDTKKLKILLNDGFSAQFVDSNGMHTHTNTYKFIDNVLSGSQNKECRQLFVLDTYLDKLKEHTSLNIEPSVCTISKNLTRNALMTTDVYVMPIEDIKKLGICIIPDCEVPVIETVQMVKPYERNADEEKQYQQLLERFDQEDAYYKQVKNAAEIVNEISCILPNKEGKNRQKEIYKTATQWKNENRKIKDDEIEKPTARTKVDSKYYPLWTIEQTEEYPDIPITEWSTGLQLVTEKNHECSENVFDGMGLVSKRLGQQMEEHLDVKYRINGYQLRLPCIKGFFPCVDFHGYYQKHHIKTIKDIWNQPHEIENIDLLITESTFKAKLNVTDEKDGKEIKEWLFESIDDYKERLFKYGYDVIGISNFAKPIDEQYRRGMYQMWLALNIKNQDIMAFSNTSGDLIHRVLSVYRKDELDWEDAKYILAFLNLTKKDDDDSNLAKDCSDAIQAIHINKKMVFDRKVIGTIKKVIDKKLDEMCLGKMYLKGIYTYITQDILAFLKYAGTEDKENWKYEGFLKEKQSYCGGRLVGNKVLARSPIVSYSEITKTEFIKYDGEDSEYISKINNIIQLPLGTECDRLGGADKDGDEVIVFELEENIKDVRIDYLQNYNFIYTDNEESPYYSQNLLEIYNGKIEESINERFQANNKVTLEDLIIPSYVQVNDDDKATAPSKEWNKENVIQFILDSEDQTGVITDYASTIANVANSEGDVSKYALPIAIMKDLQGKMIDASKSGLFDQVVIPEVIKRKFRGKPQFMYYKDGKEYNKDYQSKSAIDFLAQEMTKFKEYVEKVMQDRTSAKIKAHKFDNIVNLLQNKDLNQDAVEEMIKKLDALYTEFTNKNSKLAKEKRAINAYSSDEKAKRDRRLIDEKFKVLYKEIKEKAEKICNCPSLLATAAVKITYLLKYSDSRSFCWVIASEGILQNLKMNEDKQKVYIKRSKKQDKNTFEWLGEFYQVDIVEDEYIPDYKGKDMSIPDEYLKKAEEQLEDICDIEVTIMNVEKGRTEEIANELKGNSYVLFETDRGWIGFQGDMSIKEQDLLRKRIIIRKYFGKEITIKEIKQANNNQSVIKAIVDVKG
ncbi:hypothetical protein [Schinkia azotoformans]|uniref:hypothetical protein n=1 Tax=Schinkia azotoformans TaxID=1454 RepID=UPI002DBFAA4F|nr:hypothetical protein [Schinkia azotoformans]MEC1788619.1 hypothetical protein [Schinkia azotoformans]MED4419938.1 hypothetical protein [Schinkia azotoformans]